MTQIRVEVRTLVSKVVPLVQDDEGVNALWSFLDMLLSYEIHNSVFIKAMSNNRFIQEMWDGKKHLFSVKTGAFPTGLLPHVLEALTEYDIDFVVNDSRPEYLPGEHTYELSPLLQFREYQREAVSKCIVHKRGIIWARPRAGKTLMEVMLVKELNLFPVLSICQSIDIARQTMDKFKTFLPDVKVGIIGDGECDIQPVTIATIQSLSAAYKTGEKWQKDEIERPPHQQKLADIQRLVETSKVVWVDECHHGVSSTHEQILGRKIYSAEYIIGCSGTPFREDNTDLLMQGLLGPVIYEINYTKLIEEGFLVRPTVHLIALPKEEHIKLHEGTYASIYKAAITHNVRRNAIISKVALNLMDKGKTSMILVNKITHGKEIAKMIPGSKFSYSKSEGREKTWEDLRVGKLKCLITTLGDEGIDIPNLSATIIAAGGKSAIKVFQRMRCMTPSPGKSSAIVVDFIDPYKYLKAHSKKRADLYQSEPSFIVKRRNA